MDLLHKISRNKTKAGVKASGLLKCLNKYSSLFVIRELYGMFGIIETTNVAPQAPSLKIRQSVELINTCRTMLENKRQHFEWLQHTLEELDIESSETRKRPTRYDEEGGPGCVSNCRGTFLLIAINDAGVTGHNCPWLKLPPAVSA